MKQEIDYSPLGFYRPSMFHLNVATTLPLNDWTKWNDTTLCTFFHEYIHFLQDIMTVFGLQNTFINGEYIAYACNEIYPKGKPASFDVPIIPKPGPQYIYENKVMSFYTTGRVQPNQAIVPNLNPFHVEKPRKRMRIYRCMTRLSHILQYRFLPIMEILGWEHTM